MKKIIFSTIFIIAFSCSLKSQSVVIVDFAYLDINFSIGNDYVYREDKFTFDFGIQKDYDLSATYIQDQINFALSLAGVGWIRADVTITGAVNPYPGFWVTSGYFTLTSAGYPYPCIVRLKSASSDIGGVYLNLYYGTRP